MAATPGAAIERPRSNGGTFATMGQKSPEQIESSDDRAAALQRAQAALDAGDEAACIEAVEEAKTM